MLKRMLVVMMTVGVSCRAPTGEDVGTSPVAVAARVLGSTAGLTVEVSGPGLSPALLFNMMARADGEVVDTIQVPSGGGRRFVVTAIDTLGVATHRADTTVSLQPGVYLPLSLVLRPLSSSVRLSITMGATRDDQSLGLRER